MANVTTREVEELLRKGFSVAEIGKKFNVTRQAIYCHVTKLKKKEKSKAKFSKPQKNYNSLINWKIYNEKLVKRGEILFDFDLFRNWSKELVLMNEDKAGRPYKFPQSFIEFLLRLKCIFKIDYRTLEGIAQKLVRFISERLTSPDYTTLQVRFSKLRCSLKVYEAVEEQEIAGDATGLKTSNRGEYKKNKYRGKRKKFIKLHLVVNTKTRQIIACSVTKEEVRDGKEMPQMLSQARKHGRIARALFDKAYDSIENHWRLKEASVKLGIKPKETMKLDRVNQEIERESKRLNEIEKKKRLKLQKRLLRLTVLQKYLQNKEKWKREVRYGQRWKVEGRYSIFKRSFGEYVFSKIMGNIRNEVMMKVNLMNLFTYLTKDTLSPEVECPA